MVTQLRFNLIGENPHELAIQSLGIHIFQSVCFVLFVFPQVHSISPPEAQAPKIGKFNKMP